MFSGLLRLVYISIGTLIMTFFVVFIVRWVGSQQHYTEPPHPWFALASWIVTQPNVEETCLSRTVPSSISSEWIVMIEIAHYEGTWSLRCQNHLPLATLLQNSRHAQWLIQIYAHETSGLNDLIELLGKYGKEKSFGIYAPSQTVARYMRKMGPEWLYAADAAAMLRFHMFSSLWLETAVDFWPDFVVQSADDKNMHTSEREQRELERRKKRIVELR